MVMTKRVHSQISFPVIYITSSLGLGYHHIMCLQKYLSPKKQHFWERFSGTSCQGRSVPKES